MAELPRWSEAALALFDLSGPTALEAGAGSGKTTCLVELATRLLSGEATGDPLPPSAIVAITFTDRAGEELAERLRAAVAQRARTAPAGSAEAAAWRSRLAGLDRLVAGTIHAFAAGLLREHAPEAGLDPEFAQLDEEQAAAWRLEAARQAVLAAVEAGEAAASELASLHGAGGLADLVADLARERASRGLTGPPELPEDAAAAALEARARLAEAARELLATRRPAGTPAAWSTLEAFAAAWEGVPPADLDGAIDAEARRRLLAAAGAAGARRGGGSLAEARERLQVAAQDFERLSAEALGRRQAAELGRLVVEAEGHYAERKRQAPALDFDDLLLRARDLLSADAGLRAELRSRIRALLLDEVQDVNPVQQEIADLLCAPQGPGSPGPPATLVAVGDPKQSIYRFRGADVSVFRRLVARLGSGQGGGRVLRLQDNHRSTAAVLEVVNAVSARAIQPASLPAAPYELSFGPADALRARRSGGSLPACEILVDAEAGSRRAAERREREAGAVSARIAALVSGRAGVLVPGPEGAARPPRLGDIALLFRRLTQVGEYEQALRSAGIPYRLARGGGFYQAPEVRDLGELLASLADPEDRLAWAALLRSPLCGLSDGAVVLAMRAGLPWKEAGTAAEELGTLLRGMASPASPATEVARLRRFLSTWQGLRSLRDRLAPAGLLEEAADGLDLEAALLAAPDGERRRDNLRKALALARRHGASGGTAAGLATRLRRLAALPPREPEAELPAGDAVALLTVHQAKGLEWPVVFVPDLGGEPRLDSRRALIDGAGRICTGWADARREEHVRTAALEAARVESRRAASAESRRLLYVALTRARDYLVLSGSAGRRGDTWSALVEAGLAGAPGLALRVPYPEAGRFTAGTPVVPPIEGARGRPEAPSAPHPAPPAPLLAVRAAVTDLAEAARCPTRHYLSRRLKLAERPDAPVGWPDDDPERATARGTLAHAMLAELDLDALPLERRARLAASAQRRGHDPAAPATRRILDDLCRFLDSPGGRWLAARGRAGALRREVPFLLRLEGRPACYLTGALDALVEETDGSLRIVDFKYALPGRGSADRYRLQLCAYALAASRAHPGRPIRAGLQFLRGRFDQVDLTPSAQAMADFAGEAPALAALLHAGGAERSPASLGRDRDRCQAEGCGFIYRCYPVAGRPRN